MSLQSPTNKRPLLLDLTYETASGTQVESFTNSNAPLTVDGDVYLPLTMLRVSDIDRDGSMEMDNVEIDLDNTLGVLQPFVTGRAAREIAVILREIAVDGSAATGAVVTLFKGKVDTVTANPGGGGGVFRLACRDIKTEAQRNDTGLEMDPQCVWSFGDPKTCGATPRTENGTLTVIDRTRVTITGLPAAKNFEWQSGTVTYDGYSISILKWGTGTEFILAEYPPQSWVDNLANVGPLAVQVRNGCDQTLGRCRGVHDNETRFMGPGFAIPPFHPLIEND